MSVIVKNSTLNLRPISGKAGLITVTTAAKTYQDMTIPAGVTALTMSESCTHVTIVTEVSDLRQRADGSAPTSTVGAKLSAGHTETMHVNDFKARQWIRDTGASSDGKIWVQQHNNG